MQSYLALLRLAIQRQFSYRAAMLAGLATNFFFGILRASVMIALYAERSSVEGLSLTDAITYTGLSQAAIAYLSLFSWFEVVNSVNSGQVGADLLKPMSYQGFWLAQDLGRSLVNLLLRGLTIMLFFALAYDISFPTRSETWLALLLSLVLAWLLSFAWRFLINLSAFWTPGAYGLCRLFFGLSWLFSGFLMPLRFMPPWFQSIAYLTPFPYMINVLIEIYFELLPGPALTQALLMQALWAVLLLAAGQIALQAGVRRLVVQGG